MAIFSFLSRRRARAAGLDLPVPLHMQEPFTLLAEPRASEELDRALTGIVGGRELALGQMRLIATLMDREKADHEARMAVLMGHHANISRRLGEASAHSLPQAEAQVLSQSDYRLAVSRATAAAGAPAASVNTQAAAAARMQQAAAAIAAATGTKP